MDVPLCSRPSQNELVKQSNHLVDEIGKLVRFHLIQLSRGGCRLTAAETVKGGGVRFHCPAGQWPGTDAAGPRKTLVSADPTRVGSRRSAPIVVFVVINAGQNRRSAILLTTFGLVEPGLELFVEAFKLLVSVGVAIGCHGRRFLRHLLIAVADAIS